MTEESKQVDISVKTGNPHLSSWELSLSQKISDKEKALKDAERDLVVIRKRNEEHQIGLRKIETLMNDALHKVESSILKYQESVDKSIRSFNEAHLDDDIENKGRKLFVLYKDMYKQACTFFSRKEFNKQATTLCTEPKTMSEHIWRVFAEITEGSQEDAWMDWLNPVWSMEEYFENLNTQFQEAKKFNNQSNKKCEDIMTRFEESKEELTALRNEMDALKEFSVKIKKCRSNSLSANNSPKSTQNSEPEFYNAYDVPSGVSDEDDDDEY
jgi:predicted  nucleic acid-binding Zn-ribbon protein